jgi:integrase
MAASPLGNILLSEVTTADIAAWRDLRLGSVQSDTVTREMNLLSHAFSIARKEWKWIAASPTTDVARPKAKPHRDRRISQDEIERICVALDWRHDAQDMIPTSTKQRVALVLLFAIETAMRSGEICALRKEDVNGAVARLHMTKNGFPRDVALSPRALERWKVAPDGFGVTTASLDAMFRVPRHEGRCRFSCRSN